MGPFISRHFTAFISVILRDRYTFQLRRGLMKLTISKGVDLSYIILVAAENLNPSPSQGNAIQILVATSFFITFATTLASTTFIAYRIHALSRHGVQRSTRKRVKYIIEMLVQSAAAYSMTSFGYAVLTVLPETVNNYVVINAANLYLSAFYFFIAVRIFKG